MVDGESTDPESIESADARTKVPCLSGWCAVLVVGLLLFSATANRGAQWQDSGYIILRIATQQLDNPLGLALVHPLHHWIGRAFVAITGGMIEPCFAVTLVSVFAGAVTVANIYGCVLLLGRRRFAAMFGAGSLMVAHTFWQMSTRTESYTLVTALMTGECWLLIAYVLTKNKRYLWGMLLLNGLGLANHMLASLTTPVLVVVVLLALRRREIRARDAVVGGALWLVGSLPYTGLVLLELVRSGDFAGTLRSALFGHAYAGDVLNASMSVRFASISAAFIVLNFPNLLLPAACYGLMRGIWQTVPPLAARCLLAGLVIHAFFVLRYSIADQYTFFLPMYAYLCMFGGAGLASVRRWESRGARQSVSVAAVVMFLLTPVACVMGASVARDRNVLASMARNKPYRDDYTYLFVPWSSADDSAERMSRQAVDLAGGGGLILVEDEMASFAVKYAAVRSGNKEIDVTIDWTGADIAQAASEKRDVVLVPASVDKPPAQPPVGSWIPQGDLYLLEPHVSGS